MRFIVILILLLAVIGGGWYGYNTYIVETDQPNGTAIVDDDNTSTDDSSNNGTGDDGNATIPDDDNGSSNTNTHPDPVAEAARLKALQAWETKLTTAKMAWDKFQYYEAYVQSHTMMQSKLPAELLADTRQLLQKSQQAYWMTRNILPEPWAGQKTVTWIKTTSGNEWYVYIEDENNRTITMRTKTGSTMDYTKSRIAERKEFSREEFMQRESKVIDDLMRQSHSGSNETRRQWQYAAIEHAWANKVASRLPTLMDKGLQSYPELGWWVYQKEAKKQLQRLMYLLAKGKDGNTKSVREILTQLYWRYASGGFLQEAEMMVFGSTGNHASYLTRQSVKHPDPTLKNIKAAIETSLTRLGDESDSDAGGGLDSSSGAEVKAPTLDASASFSKLRKEAKRYREKGDSFFRKADPDNSQRGDADQVSHNLSLAVNHYIHARTLLTQAIEKAPDAKAKTKLQKDLRTVRRLISICRKMKRIE